MTDLANFDRQNDRLLLFVPETNVTSSNLEPYKLAQDLKVQGYQVNMVLGQSSNHTPLGTDCQREQVHEICTEAQRAISGVYGIETVDLSPRSHQRYTTQPRRTKLRIPDASAAQLVHTARQLMLEGKGNESFDLYEQAIDSFPEFAVEILAEVYEIGRARQQNRYEQYQSRYFDFNIKPGQRVLDVGSGHLPFPMATDLAEYAPEDNSYGRAGQAFNNDAGLPVTACSVEKMPFKDKEFDFVYCSHVLEHVTSPEKACQELMRVAKRGYLETPARVTDLFFNTARISNHHWNVQYRNHALHFYEYTEDEITGLNCDINLQSITSPQSPREKALAALMVLKSDKINTMLYWNEGFNFKVHRNS